jgi:hypothetical protein
MNEGYLKNFFTTKILPESPESDFETWTAKAGSSDSYKSRMFGEVLAIDPESDFEEWNTKVWGQQDPTPKQTAPLPGLGGGKTVLSSKEERAFGEFMSSNPAVLKWKKEFELDGIVPDIETPDYDYRGAWKAGIVPEPTDEGGGKMRHHWGSKGIEGKDLKSESHPTRWKSDYMDATGKDPDKEGVSEVDAKKVSPIPITIDKRLEDYKRPQFRVMDLTGNGYPAERSRAEMGDNAARFDSYMNERRTMMEAELKAAPSSPTYQKVKAQVKTIADKGVWPDESVMDAVADVNDRQDMRAISLAVNDVKMEVVDGLANELLQDFSDFYKPKDDAIRQVWQQQLEAENILKRVPERTIPNDERKLPGDAFNIGGWATDYLKQERFAAMPKEQKMMLRERLVADYEVKRLADRAAVEVEERYDRLGIPKPADIKERLTATAKDLDDVFNGRNEGLRLLGDEYANDNEVIRNEYEETAQLLIEPAMASAQYKEFAQKLHDQVQSGEVDVKEAERLNAVELNRMLSEMPELKRIEQKSEAIRKNYLSEYANRKKALEAEIVKRTADIDKDISGLKEFEGDVIEQYETLVEGFKQEQLREWDNMPMLEKLRRGFGGQGFGQIVGAGGSGLKWLTGGDYGSMLVDAGKQIAISNAQLPEGEEVEFEGWESISDPDWWATKVAPTLPLSASLMIPGIGIGAGVAGAVGKMGLSKVAQAVAGGAVAGVGMRMAEAGLEGAMRYEDLIKQGYSHDYASQSASEVAAQQWPLAVTDGIQVGLVLFPMGKGISSLFKALAQPGIEGMEEVYQESLPAAQDEEMRFLRGEIDSTSRKYTDGSIENMANFLSTTEGQEVFAIGAIIGTGFTVPGIYADWKGIQYDRLIAPTLEKMMKEGVPVGLDGDAMREAIEKRRSQMVMTLNDLNTGGFTLSQEQFDDARRQIDSYYNKAVQLADMPSGQRVQIIEQLSEIETEKKALEGVTNTSLRKVGEKRISAMESALEEMMEGRAPGYFVNGIPLQKDEMLTLVNDPEFAQDVIDGNWNIVINNDNEVADIYKQRTGVAPEGVIQPEGVKRSLREKVRALADRVRKSGPDKGLMYASGPIVPMVSDAIKATAALIDASAPVAERFEAAKAAMLESDAYKGLKAKQKQSAVATLAKTLKHELPKEVDVKSEKKKYPKSFLTVPGGDAVAEQVQSLIHNTAQKEGESGPAFKTRLASDAIAWLQDTDTYKAADDSVKEEMVRDVNKMAGKTMRSAPSVKEVLEPLRITLKEWYKDRESAAKGAMKAQKGLAEQVSKALGTLPKGTLSDVQAKALVRRAGKVTADNPGSVDEFMDYATKVFEDAEYVEKAAKAKNHQKTARKKLKSKTVAPNHKAALAQMAKIPLNRLSPDEVTDFNRLADEYMRTFLPVRSREYKQGDSAKFLEEMSDIIESVDEDITQEILGSSTLTAMDVAGWTNAEIRRFLDPEFDESKSEFSKAKKAALLEELRRQAEYSRNRIAGAIAENETRFTVSEDGDVTDLADFSGLNPRQMKAVQRMSEIDVTRLNAKQLAEYIAAADNLLVNNSTGGLYKQLVVAESIEAMDAALKSIKGIALRDLWVNISKRAQSLPGMMRTIYGLNETLVDVMYHMGYGEFFKAVHKFRELDHATRREISDKRAEIYKQHEDVESVEGRSAAGMFALVADVKPDIPVDDQFQEMRDMIDESIEAREGSRSSADEARLHRGVFDELFSTARSVEDVEAKFKEKYPGSHAMWDWYTSDLLPRFNESLQDITENYHNAVYHKEGPRYSPRRYESEKGVSRTEAETIEAKSSIMAAYHNDGLSAPKQTANSITRKRVRSLPEGKVLSFNLDNTVRKYVTNALYDIHVSEELGRVSEFMNLPEASQLFGGSDNLSVISNKFADMAMKQKQVYVPKSWPLLHSVSHVAKRLGTGVTLGGFGQFPKQFSEASANTMVNLGVKHMHLYPLMLKDMVMGEADPLLDLHPIGGRSRAETITLAPEKMAMYNDAKLSRTQVENFFAKAENYLEWGNDIALLALRSGDVGAAKMAWMAYYAKYLLENNAIESARGLDWKQEAALSGSDPVRAKAAIYAENMVDMNMVPSEPTKVAWLTQPNSESGIAMLQTMLLSFATFSIEAKGRQTNDWIDLFNGERRSADVFRSAIGTLSGIAMFRFMSVFVMPTISMGLGYLLMKAVGVDDDDIESFTKEKWAKVMQGQKRYFSTLYTDIFASGMTNAGEPALAGATNAIVYGLTDLLGPAFGEELIEDAAGRKIEYSRWAADSDRTPIEWYGQKEGEVIDWGMFSIVNDIYLGETAKQLENVSNLDELTKDQQMAVFIHSALHFAHLTRLPLVSDTDIYRASKRMQQYMLYESKHALRTPKDEFTYLPRKEYKEQGDAERKWLSEQVLKYYPVVSEPALRLDEGDLYLENIDQGLREVVKDRFDGLEDDDIVSKLKTHIIDRNIRALGENSYGRVMSAKGDDRSFAGSFYAHFVHGKTEDEKNEALSNFRDYLGYPEDEWPEAVQKTVKALENYSGDDGDDNVKVMKALFSKKDYNDLLNEVFEPVRTYPVKPQEKE